MAGIASIASIAAARLCRGVAAAIRTGAWLLAACGLLVAIPADNSVAAPRHALAMHGAPALPEGFAHFPYVNPDAPKGGRLTMGLVGTFDSLNPFVVRGLAVQQMRGHVIESLLARGYDEPFTLYGLLARTVETDEARSFVTFGIDPDARFADGRPVTAQDVRFSWELLRDHGRPNHRLYYGKVRDAEILDGNRIRFDLAGSDDRELPLILGLMPIFARHATDPKSFEDTSFTPLLGSGPYRVGEVRPGQSVTFTRRPDYWGRDRGVNRGLWNFDEVRLDYYRDTNTHLEAFKRGLYDFRAENDPARWETAYDFPAKRQGKVVQETLPTGTPKGMLGYVFNTRRPIFADIRVREAITLLFDFEWANRSLFFGRYRRLGSYFEASELSAHGRPADAAERALLAPFPDAVRADVMEGTWSPPVSDGSGRDRDNLGQALALLENAGFELRNNRLVSRATGQPFTFEFLVATREDERLAMLFARDLRRAGIAMKIRSVDAVQFDRRRLAYDFDMIQNRWDQSLSPGNEQSFYWGSAAAGQDGTRNYMGMANPAADAMIAAILAARDRQELVSAVRALDRVLISGFYVVPLFYAPGQWVARWTHLARPDRTPLSGYLPESWWRRPAGVK